MNSLYILSVLNINELIILYIILNYQINKRVTLIASCYSNTNGVVLKFVIYNSFIIHVMFESIILKKTYY